VAAGIPNAVFTELLPGDHLAGDPGELTSVVLFTDIVSSTEASSARGDKRWPHNQ
jgi:hypothetical protein